MTPEKTALPVDDELDTGGSLVSTIDALKNKGVKDIYYCVTHGVLSGSATDRIAESSLKELIITDTLPLDEKNPSNKITVLSVAPLLGEAIHRIHNGLSVGAMFNEE